MNRQTDSKSPRLLRIAAVAAATWLAGRYFLRPIVVDGESMEPTYASRGFNFCRMHAYSSRLPRRGEVVLMRYGGDRWLLLKRAIAFEGETVSFSGGKCFVDGKELDEPYVKKPCGWTEPPHVVAAGHIYVLGDNRSVPREDHVGGEISLSRLYGKPLW